MYLINKGIVEKPRKIWIYFIDLEIMTERSPFSKIRVSWKKIL